MAVCTLAEVARLAGVSLSTASRVLNGSARTPGQDVAKRVKDMAESLGYIPNAQAQGLAKSTSGLIGLIVHDTADPFFSAIARGVHGAARERQKVVLLATTDGTPDDERAAVAAFAAHRADSIVIAGSRFNRPQDRLGNSQLAAELDRYCSNGGRVGVVGHPIIGAKAAGYHLVPLPNEELAAEIAKRLAADRPQEFVVIAGPDGLLTSDDRVRGFQRGLAALGMPAAEVVWTGFDRNGGYTAGLDLSRRIKARAASTSELPLCILAANDAMAFGAAAALRSEGIRIPRDASIAGFDGTELLRDFRPALSTVRLPLELIGHIATIREAADGGFSPPIKGEAVLASALA